MSGSRQKTRRQPTRMSSERGEASVVGNAGAEPVMAITEPESPAATMHLMEEVCERENLVRAWQRVRGNKGAPGVDGMTIDDAASYLREHWPDIRSQLLSGTYRPQPVRRVEIPKPDGGVRKLGVPCVVDRLIQQALLQVLQKRWDPTFSEHSYGFRPGRSAHQAVAQAQALCCRRLQHRGRSRSRKILRSSQSRCPDGARRGTGRRQARAQTHPGVPQRRGDGGRSGPSGGRGHAARRPAFAASEQPRARRSRQGADPPGPALLPIRRRLQHLCSQSPRRRTGDGLGEPVPDQQAQAQGQRGEKRGGPPGGTEVPRLQHLE